MARRILRSFLYLDENIVDDYLSQLEGGVLEGPYTTKDTSTGSKEGGGGVKIGLLEANAKGGAFSSYEVAQTIRETPVAKFTRLYKLLQQDEGGIQTLNGFDLAIYDQIEPGEIVEVRGNAKLPSWEHLSNVVSGFSDLLEVMKAVGQDPLDDATNQAYQGISALVAKKAQEDTELIIVPIGSPHFKFVARLDKAKILRRKEELEAEVTILGKVRRKLAERETIDIFRVAPRLNELEHLNRTQRRAMNKNKGKFASTDTPIDEVIKYPAMEIQPIAIYQ